MQETKTNALLIRITDTELRRLLAIKETMGLPSVPNTTLGHDLLVLGMDKLESRPRMEAGHSRAANSKSDKPTSPTKGGS
jgi:hypothetical protein